MVAAVVVAAVVVEEEEMVEVEEEEGEGEETSVHGSHVSGNGNNHSLFQKRTDWDDATCKM